jgi:hypothetical protein
MTYAFRWLPTVSGRRATSLSNASVRVEIRAAHRAWAPPTCASPHRTLHTPS